MTLQGSLWSSLTTAGAIEECFHEQVDPCFNELCFGLYHKDACARA